MHWCGFQHAHIGNGADCPVWVSGGAGRHHLARFGECGASKRRVLWGGQCQGVVAHREVVPSSIMGLTLLPGLTYEEFFSSPNRSCREEEGSE